MAEEQQFAKVDADEEEIEADLQKAVQQQDSDVVDEFGLSKLSADEKFSALQKIIDPLLKFVSLSLPSSPEFYACPTMQFLILFEYLMTWHLLVYRQPAGVASSEPAAAASRKSSRRHRLKESDEDEAILQDENDAAEATPQPLPPEPLLPPRLSTTSCRRRSSL